jgi:hypothetical protein
MDASATLAMITGDKEVMPYDGIHVFIFCTWGEWWC